MAENSLLDAAERAWNGDDTIGAHSLMGGHPIEEIADGLAMITAFSNVMPIRTDEGLVLIDTSHAISAPRIHSEVRSWTDAPVHTAVYTHGHVDHIGGLGPFEAEADERNDSPLRVLAHEAVTARFERYVETGGYNTVINQRQFGSNLLRFPSEFRYPDETFEDDLTTEVGGVSLELHHARGETDDHAWVWLPEQRALYPGDLFIWVAPNAGNPQKVQRYAAEWADALRAMAALEPELLLPSHGLPIVGADRVRTALLDTAELLSSLHDQTVGLMNTGATLDEVLHTVSVPAHLVDKPYLQPLYDDPEFIVRNVWRLVGGWFDGDPATLKPAPSAALAEELAALAGGANRLADRAMELAAAGDLRLAGHLSQLAVQAAGDDPALHRARAEIYRSRSAAEPSLMAKGVFNWVVRESESRLPDTDG